MGKVKYSLTLLATMFIFSGCNLFDDNSDDLKIGIIDENSYYEIKNISVNEPKDFKVEFNDTKNIKILSNAKIFGVSNDTLVFKEPSSVKSGEYEVKIYVVNSNFNEFLYKYKIKVISGSEDNNSTNPPPPPPPPPPSGPDSDNDYIPDNIEAMLGLDTNSSDQNGNGIIDGLEGDKFFNKQWYVKNDGIPMNPSEVAPQTGNDMNLMDVYKEYMGYNNGENIIIQIVDSGVDINHEDLKDNIDLSRSLDGSKQGNPIPGGNFKPHGTMLAGIAAARAFNGVGIRGVAPFAKIAGSNWLKTQSLDGLEAAWYSGAGSNEIAVTNNSWGRYYTADTIYEDIMQEGVKDLRDGKGRIYVFASGNARSDGADSNIQYVINNRFALVVGAVEHNNRVADYSTPGANVWISGYGGSSDYEKGPTIATTYLSGESDLTWSDDTKKNYTYAMAGSSAAAPMVAGSVALILEACPNLTWRDVKYIIAKSAKVIDTQNPSWVTNASGIKFSRDYGFGLIDTKKAISLCKNSYSLLPKQEQIDTSKDFNKTLNKNDSVAVEVDKDLKIEWVEATINLDTQNASDFDIYLVSPSGTKIKLIQSGTKVGAYFIPNSDWMRGGFRFSTGAMLEESSIGTWKLEFVNNGSLEAVLKKVDLKIYGFKG